MSEDVKVRWQLDGSCKITANGKTVHLTPAEAKQVLSEALEAEKARALKKEP